MGAVRARRPGLDVRAAFLDHDSPRLGAAVAEAAARSDSREGRGSGGAVVVPLLLGNAYHGRVDAPAALREAFARHPDVLLRLGGVLGPDPLLLGALRRRLAESLAGADPDARRGVVLAWAGSSDRRARAALEAAARHLGRPGGPAVALGEASGPGPSVAAAVAALRARGVRDVAVASWFLAPGLLHDRARTDALAAGADTVADVLGAAPEVAQAVLRRYDAAVRAGARRAA